MGSNFEKKLDSYIIPPQYFNSFFDAVSECTAETIIISEKTIKPLFYKKPFIVFAAPGFHKYLKEIGFELYNEIIDYTFDSEIDREKRADLFATELKKINDLDTVKKRKRVYKMLKPKIDRNYENMLKVIADETYIPEQVKLLMSQINDNDDNKASYITKYREILKVVQGTNK